MFPLLPTPETNPRYRTRSAGYADPDGCPGWPKSGCSRYRVDTFTETALSGMESALGPSGE
jgi:hypothetical protein